MGNILFQSLNELSIQLSAGNLFRKGARHMPEKAMRMAGINSH
jgi:hypothetical protein